MGTCITLTAVKFEIKSQHCEEASRAIGHLMQEGIARRGGVPFDYVNTQAVLESANLEGQFEQWGWPITLSESKDVIGIHFSGEKKADESYLFSTIAPYVTSGSFIELRTEEGGQIVWNFDGESCT